MQLIEHLNEELSKVWTVVTDLQNYMKSKLDDRQLKDIDDRCTALLDGYKKELSEIKLRKYCHDTLDYKNNQVHRWLFNPVSLSSGLLTKFFRSIKLKAFFLQVQQAPH